MGRRAKSSEGKADTKRASARKSSKDEGARVRHLERELEARNRDLSDALEQQAATGEIWRVISGFPNDLQLMMNVVAENAARVCGAIDAVVFKLESGELRSVASHGGLPVRPSLHLDRGHVSGRAVIDRKPVHVHDVLAAESEFPISAVLARQGGIRTQLSVPLLHGGLPVGAIGIRAGRCVRSRTARSRSFQSFADQAGSP